MSNEIMNTQEASMPEWAVDLNAKLDLLLEQIMPRTPFQPTAPVLSKDEAMMYVGKKSRSAFGRWIMKFAKESRVSNGRFKLTALQRGREKEARGYTQ